MSDLINPKAVADELRACVERGTYSGGGYEYVEVGPEDAILAAATIDALVMERDDALARVAFAAAIVSGDAVWDKHKRLKQSERERDDLRAERDRLIEVVRKVRAYADDRAFHSKRHNNTVNSGRIASDLYHILNDASLGSSTQWQYSYAEKWEDGSGVNERVTFNTEAKARQYFADNAPEVAEMNKYRESVGDLDRILPVLEKRRVVEPGDWLPLEAMTVDPVTGV